MNKKLIWWILVVYSFLSIIKALTSGGAGAVNLAAVSGIIIATIFYTRRYVPEKRKTVSKCFILISLVATVVSVVMAIALSKEGIAGNIISNIGSGICNIALILLADGKKFEFMENCDMKKFVVILLICLILLPSVMLMVSGFVSFILAVILVIVFAGAMFSNLDTFMLSQQSTRTVFKDDKGFEHATAYDKDKANDEYRSKEN